MKASPGAFSGAIPRFKPIRVLKRFVTAAEDLGLHLWMYVVFAHQIILVLKQPVKKSLAILRGEF